LIRAKAPEGVAGAQQGEEAAMSHVLNRSPKLRTARRGLLLACVGGVAAAFCYVATVLLGGAIVPGYSHLRHSVSELTSPGAPYRTLLAFGFLLYNGAVALLGAGLLRSSVPSRSSRIAGVLLIVCAAAGILQLEPFPQDPMGSPITAAGGVHIALAGLSAITLVVALLMFARAWRDDPIWRTLRGFSVIVAIAILVTGGVGAALVTSPVFGLLERLTQLSFLSWFAAVGVLGLRRAKR
jgi:hypothetical protein